MRVPSFRRPALACLLFLSASAADRAFAAGGSRLPDQAPSAPPQAASPLQDSIERVQTANAALDQIISALDLSWAPAAVRKFFAEKAAERREQTFDLTGIHRVIVEKREEFERTGDKKKAADWIEGVAGSFGGAPPQNDDDSSDAFMTELYQEEGASYKPYSDMTLANMALAVSFNNFNFSIRESMRSDYYPFVFEFNAAAAQKGEDGLGAGTMAAVKDMIKKDGAREQEWARLDRYVIRLLPSAPKDFKAKTLKIMSCTAYREMPPR